MGTQVGVAPEKVKEYVLRNEAEKRANADPLPGPLAVAFGPQDIVVGDFKIRPLVAYDWAIMKHLNSPLYRQMLEVMQLGDEAPEVESEPEDAWDLIFLMTRPCKEADAYFKKGKEAFHDAAKEAIGFRLNILQISQLLNACIQQVQNHMKTMVGFGTVAEKEEGVEVQNFQVAEVKPVTASAGG